MIELRNDVLAIDVLTVEKRLVIAVDDELRGRGSIGKVVHVIRMAHIWRVTVTA
jgi:hypothetical protein